MTYVITRVHIVMLFNIVCGSLRVSIIIPHLPGREELLAP